MSSTESRSQEAGAGLIGSGCSFPRRWKSAATVVRLLFVIVGLIILVSCGGGSNSTTSSSAPAVTLSATSLTFTSGVNVASAAQTVTVTNSGSATLTFSSIAISPTNYVQTNTCGTSIAAGANCTISVTFTPPSTSAVSGTLTITDNASGSPQTVTLSGTGESVSVSPSSLSFSSSTLTGTATLSNAGTSSVSITSIAITTGSSNFSETNTCGSSLAASTSCTITVTFTVPSSGTVTGTLTITDAAGTQTVSLSGTSTTSNQAQVTVGFGPNGYVAPSASSTSETLAYYNDITTTVTVCQPGTTNCTTIPDVLVDTGSVGLRLLGTGATGVTTQVNSLNLPTISDPTTGYPIYECVQYGDLSYTWGPMAMATVTISGETAVTTPGGTANAGIPIQVISTSTPPSDVSYEGEEYDTPCLINSATDEPSGGVDDDTVAALGDNGILGIGTYPQDCGENCTNIDDVSGDYIAYDASTGAAYIETTALTSQAWNPVAAFPVDNNGVMVNLPSIPAAGAASVTGNYLTFGIGTETNNAITTQTTYEIDDYGNFASATFNGVTYTSTNSYGSFIDSGSNALYVSDAATIPTTDCTISGYDIYLYCPSSPLSLSLGLTGENNGTSGTVTLSIENALNLFSANPTFAALNDLGGDSGDSSSTDYFDLGLPFFYNNTIFVGISGTSTTAPNGYWAF